MRKSSKRLASLLVSAGVSGGLGLSAGPALAAGNSGSATGASVDIGPFPGTAPVSCPPGVTTDDFNLNFVSGTVNKSHETTEGDANLVDNGGGVPTYFGHATLWGNATNFTMHFHGTSQGGQNIDFHLTYNKPHVLQVANMKCS